MSDPVGDPFLGLRCVAMPPVIAEEDDKLRKVDIWIELINNTINSCLAAALQVHI